MDLVAASPTVTSSTMVDPSGPASLAQVLSDVEQQVSNGVVERLRPLPTGFSPLDEVLNGGVRPGELLIVGGPVGKTILGVTDGPRAVCHDPPPGRLYLLRAIEATSVAPALFESAERSYKEGRGLDG
jgi:hypothetical protein